MEIGMNTLQSTMYLRSVLKSVGDVILSVSQLSHASRESLL